MASLQVAISLPEGSSAEGMIDLSEVTVKLQNKSNSFSYSSKLNASGEVTFLIQPGKYDLLASAGYENGIAVNASATDFILTENGIVDETGGFSEARLSMTFNVVIPSALIIREIYYHGSSTLDGASYTKDRYIELYNNGTEGLYIDSLCVASVFPYNSTTGNNAWQGKDTVAIAGMCWMIPGNGSNYYIEPGKSCVLAYCAVDHTNRCTSHLDMSKADFGFYDDKLSGHEIAAGVQPLTRIIAGLGTAWALSISSPAVVIFRPSQGVAAYLADAADWERYEPGKSSGTKYWHIAKGWILDGVECVQSPAKSVKRLPESVDASYVYMESANYSGKVVTRKEKETRNGVVIYRDTNNSSEDFQSDCDPDPHFNK